jgi:hypothetical protein
MQLPIVLIGLEADGSREANGSPETIPVTCAWARFAGSIFLRHIILALLTVCLTGAIISETHITNIYAPAAHIM